jgi:hypothetical protein
MKIEQLIQVFEKALITYEKAVKEKWSHEQCVNNDLYRGLCLFIRCRYNIIIYHLFMLGDYYENFIRSDNFIGPIMTRNNVTKPLKLRIKFLKQQIPELKQLLEQGYTHV